MSSPKYCGTAALRGVILTIAIVLNAATVGQAAQVNHVRAASVRNAVTITYTTIDDPVDQTFNQTLGINDDSTIVGDFGSGAVGHPNQAYASLPPYTTFVPLSFPGAMTTRVTGIGDDGSISGFWSPTSGLSGANYGFVDWNEGSSGVFIDLSVNDPFVASAPPVNQVLSFNHGTAVGLYKDVNKVSHGFVYTVKTGVFAPVNIVGATSVAVAGLTETGLYCGYFTEANGQTLAFLTALGGSPTVFQVPGSTTTEFLGVSGDTAIGFYTGANGVRNGLSYKISTGAYTTANDPNGAKGTTLNAINGSNQVVGYYVDSAGITHGMLVIGL